MARDIRHKTTHKGVYYVMGTEIGRNKSEKVFYIRYRKAGKSVEEKAGRAKADDMTAARAATMRAAKIAGERPANEEKRETEKRALLAEDNKWTIDRLWNEYAAQKEDNKSFRTDKSRYNLYLKNAFADKAPSDIIQLEVDRLRVKLLKKKSPQTAKHVLALLKRLIKFGTDRGLCAPLRFTIKLPKVSNEKTEFLAPDELERLLKAIEADSHPLAGPIMKMALFTGMRRGELFKLKWADVDFDNSFIDIVQPKGGKDQKIPLNDGARQVLQGMHKGKSPYVFAGRNGKQRVDINKALAVIKNAAGLPKDFRPLHGLRHHYASMLANSGEVTPFALQRLLCHKDLRMTTRYSHLSDKVLKEASGVANDIINQAMNGKIAKVK